MDFVTHLDNDGKEIEADVVYKSILHYCKYQERCHQEVHSKLYDLGCNAAEAGNYIARLIDDGALNEERFAIAYARGKFRIHQWGKLKIKQQLKFRRVTDYCIRKALAGIDSEAYERTLVKLTEKKLADLRKEPNQKIREFKAYKYLIQKGYERDLVIEIINRNINK